MQLRHLKSFPLLVHKSGYSDSLKARPIMRSEKDLSEVKYVCAERADTYIYIRNIYTVGVNPRGNILPLPILEYTQILFWNLNLEEC
jgi:hypothetical protein